MVDVAGSIASVVSSVLEVCKWLGAPTWRQFKYLFNYTTNFKNLEEEVKKLEYMRDEVQRKVTDAERNVEVIKQHVKDWQKDAEETITEAKQLIQAKANNPRCFKGLCPNFIIHYKQSRKAFKLKRDDIDPLLQPEGGLSSVSYQTNQPEIWLRSSENYLAFESRNSTVKNVWDALNDKNVFMIGVYGMGGLGKTTLVEEIGRKAEKAKIFQDIVLVEVSKSPDEKKIQKTIANKLGLKFKNENENENENESEMAKKIYSRMKDKKILLILDNIWEHLEFEKTIGIPCGADRGENKLLFTTRDLDVLKMMGSTNNFKIDILNEEEAWTLFTKMAGNVIQTHKLHYLVNDVCKECRGLPIIICTIAKTLRNKSDLNDWEVALKELKAPSPTEFLEPLEKEYMKIELSYKYLRDDELKKIFLIASLLENNTSISDLFKHVVCLDILKGANLTMEEKRARLERAVRKLKDACLLVEGFSCEQFAMHDVIRAIATRIAYMDHHVFTMRNDVEQQWQDKDKLRKCTKISLPGNSTIISQLWPNDLDCPNLEYFYMTNTWNSSFEIPEDFFKVMPKLRVLNLVGLRQLSLPSSIALLTNLQTLCLDNSIFENVAIIGKLNKLKVLSLQKAFMIEFLMELGQLTQLRLLDLSYCSPLKVIAPNVISKLSQLEELYLRECCIQWEIEVLTKLQHLSKLASLELDINNDKVLPKDFFFRKLIRYKISVGNWQYQCPITDERECLRILKLIINPTVDLEELDGIKNVELLCLAEYLDDEGKDDLEHSKFNLRYNEITPLFNKEVMFPNLMVLVLKNIISRKIWDNQLPSSSFKNLKQLILWRCTKIKFVFPYTITKNLEQLQYLEIKDCIDLEEIVATEDITEAAASFVFPEITFLKLGNLPELATFYPGIHTFKWPKLKTLEMKDCEKLKMFNLEPNSLCLDHKINHDLEVFILEIQGTVITWSSQPNACKILHDKSANIPLQLLQRFESVEKLELCGCEYKEIKSVSDIPNLNVLHVGWCSKLVSLVPSSTSLQNLKVLEVIGCTKLVNLTTPSTARSLMQLKELNISKCEMLVEILENEGDATTIEIAFENLNKLSLNQLESLTCFCSGNYSFNFPLLKELIITECPNMSTFSRGISSISEFTLQFNEITSFFNQKVIFPNSEVLELKNISLGKTWNNEFSTCSYQNLTHLILYYCDKIKYVFPLSIAKNLQQLQCLELMHCKVLERVVVPEEGTEATVNFFFPQVSTVKLQNLPEFTDFYPGIHTSKWPKLKELEVQRCPKFKMLTSEPNFLCFDQEINYDLEIFQLNNDMGDIGWWSQSKCLKIFYYEATPIPLQLLQRFQNLTCLLVARCYDLVNLTIPSAGRILVQLRELKILSCEMLMEILEIEEDATTEIVFENLNKLSLYKMESLTCFCSRNYTFNFPSLEELNIIDCPNMMTFCKGILSTPKLQKINYEGMEVENEGNNLNKTIQGLYERKNQDISLDLKLLTLKDVNSTEICYNQRPTFSYQNLTHLSLWNCENIKYAFPSSIARSLQQLQQLKIQNCKVLEGLVAEEDGANTVVDFVFPNITLLEFKDLPELTTFYPGICTLELPKLKELVVKYCTKYMSLKENNVETELNILDPKSIFLNDKINFNLEVFELYDGKTNICWQGQSETLTIEKDNSTNIPLRLLQRFENVRELQLYWSQYKDIKSLCDLPNLEILEVRFCYRLISLVPFSGSFKNLKVLKVYSCDRLIMKLITHSVAKSLVHLRELSISYCDKLTEVVENKGDATSTKIVFNSLNKLSLECLNSLICFCSGNYSFCFPSLKELIIQECPNLKTFCQGSLSTPKLERVSYKEHDPQDDYETKVEIMENNLNTTIQQEHKKEVGLFWHRLTLSGRDIMTTLQGEFQGNFDKVVILQLIKDDHVYIPIRILQKFIHLEELILTVSLYEEIFSCGEGEDYVGALTKLKDLHLQGLFNLKCIWKQDFRFKSILQNLHSLDVEYCHNLITLLPSLSSFKNLTTLYVKYCDGMQNLMTSSTVKSLACLKSLSIRECEMMIEVLANEGDVEKDDIVFERLKELRLSNLESLTCFYYGNYTLKFPFLESLVVNECSKMKTFSREGVNMPKLQRVNEKDCSNDRNYVTTQLQNDCSKLWEIYPLKFW